MNFAKFLRTPFLQNTSGRLLLHIVKLSESLDSFSADYEKVIILTDFNVEVNDNHMKSFCENYGFKNLIKQTTCYKNPILTHVPRSFQSTCVTETGLSDSHMMT